MIVLLVLSGLSGALAVPRTSGQEADAAPRNPILEGVAVQAGDGLVLLSEYERYLTRALERQPPADRAAEARTRAELLRELALRRLEEQSGADLGLDPAVVERIRRSTVAEQRREKGLEGYLATLDEKGTDALTEELETEQDLYRQLFHLDARGQAYGTKRRRLDQGVRPGELRAFYAENLDKLAPTTVQLRWLIVSSEALGSPEAARASCEDARARVLAGEDFALLVEERGAELRETRGLTPFRPPAAFPDPALAAFSERAEVGELSEVLPLTNPRTGAPDPRFGYHFAELHERRVPPTPEFTEREVQRVLRDVLVRRRTGLVVEERREGLWRDSYRWVSPLLAPTEPAAAPPASR